MYSLISDKVYNVYKLYSLGYNRFWESIASQGIYAMSNAKALRGIGITSFADKKELPHRDISI